MTAPADFAAFLSSYYEENQKKLVGYFYSWRRRHYGAAKSFEDIEDFVQQGFIDVFTAYSKSKDPPATPQRLWAVLQITIHRLFIDDDQRNAVLPDRTADDQERRQPPAPGQAEIAAALHEVVSRHGSAVLNDPQLWERELRGRGPIAAGHIPALLEVLHAGIPQRLLGVLGVRRPEDLAGRRSRSVPETTLEDCARSLPLATVDARWAVETWASALGLSTRRRRLRKIARIQSLSAEPEDEVLPRDGATDIEVPVGDDAKRLMEKVIERLHQRVSQPDKMEDVLWLMWEHKDEQIRRIHELYPAQDPHVLRRNVRDWFFRILCEFAESDPIAAHICGALSRKRLQTGSPRRRPARARRPPKAAISPSVPAR